MNVNSVKYYAWRMILASVLIVLMSILWKSLHLTTHLEPLKQKNEPFPDFYLADIRKPQQWLSSKDLKGQVSIVHVWASWCDVCIKEQKNWITIKEQVPYPVMGIIYRDDIEQALAVLKRVGDPYTFLISDTSGRMGLALGLTGTPESFIVDKSGTIRFHYLGPVTQQTFEKVFLPILETLKNEVQ